MTARGLRSVRDGYVLVEALATLALSALVLALLGSLISVMLRAADRSARLVEQHEAVTRTLDAVGREVEDMVRLHWSGDQAADFVFTGLADRVMFVRRRIGSGGLPEQVAVAFQSGPVDGGAQLLRAEAPVRPGIASLADLVFTAPQAVAQGKGAFVFAYEGPDESGSPSMQPTWTRTDRLPTAIQLTATGMADGAPSATLRMPVRITAEPACAKPSEGVCSLDGMPAGDQAGGDAGKPASPKGGPGTEGPPT